MKQCRTQIVICACCLLLLVVGFAVRSMNSTDSQMQPWHESAVMSSAPESQLAVTTGEIKDRVPARDDSARTSIPDEASRSIDAPAQPAMQTNEHSLTADKGVNSSGQFEFSRLPEFRNDLAVVHAAGPDNTPGAGTHIGNEIPEVPNRYQQIGFQSDIFVDNAQHESGSVIQVAPSATSVFSAQDSPRKNLHLVSTEQNQFRQESVSHVARNSGEFVPAAPNQPNMAVPITGPLAAPVTAGTVPTAPATSSPEPEGGGPTAALNARDFRMATQPQIGDHHHDDKPVTDGRAWQTDFVKSDFAPDPVDPYLPYDPYQQMNIYQGKKLNANQRPLIELGRPWYQLGQLAEPSTIFGAHNPVSNQFIIFGDYRTGFASNDLKGDDTTQIAWQLNLFMNLQMTGTERLVTSMTPLGQGKNTRYIFDHDQFATEFDADLDFGYFEGDLGAIVGGLTGETLPFDLPFAVGFMPLLVQNGVWMEDAFVGVAATIPARNSPRLDISNMDFTFFGGFDEIDSPAFEGDDDVAKMWGMLSFIEAMNGFWEIDYAFLEDRSFRDRSYHNIGIGYTRRYGRFVSNSTRMIVNAGQSTNSGPNTADGVLFLSENSLISGAPSSIVPYFNMFAGFDRPQSAARAGAAGGVLRNTGILFESDNLTGYPTLDATGNDTFGAAFGVNIMPDDFTQQLVLEVAGLGTMGNDVGRIARGTQLGTGFRYQLPLSNSLIFRTDGMFGWLDNENDVHGFRMELRRKF